MVLNLFASAIVLKNIHSIYHIYTPNYHSLSYSLRILGMSWDVNTYLFWSLGGFGVSIVGVKIVRAAYLCVHENMYTGVGSCQNIVTAHNEES